MASNTKEIQRRIKSIRNTRKITRAMEMVSAAKMKKEVSRVLAIRTYAHAAWNVLTNLSIAFRKHNHCLLAAREVRKILVILITSNRGLCGGFNSQIIKKTMQQVKRPHLLKVNRIGVERIDSSVPDEEIEFDFITVGKKGFQYLVANGYNVIASFDDLNYLPSADAVRPVARIAIDDYTAEKYDKIVVAYTDYINPAVQQPKLRQILPISKIDLEKQIAEIDAHAEALGLNEREIDYKFEPKPAEVLEHIMPRLVEMQLYHAVLESNASKESARMLAMRNATDAATDMSNQLQHYFNQIRQTNITQEIAEITSGRVALED
jgi:F-type H+-transporting ATPase subunit gamma